MIVKKEHLNVLSILYFVLDNVMFWEAFRWERFDTGHIYIQKFPNGKMYAGQTINLKKRMNEYRRLKGNNTHHTRALKKRIDTMQIAIAQCPNYLLDAVEIFVISFYDLTDCTKGYNKTTGGRKNFRHTKETRKQISEKVSGKNNPMYGKCGDLSPCYGRKHTEEELASMSEWQKGEKSPMFGKTLPEEVRAKISEKLRGENHPLFGKSPTEEIRIKISIGNIGKKHTEDTRASMSIARTGGKNYNSKPVCVFGKLYDSASTASKLLREVCNTTSEYNFIAKWIQKPIHHHNIFYVTKEFYNETKYATKIITRDVYEHWLSSSPNINVI
ncbi:GIY-YIG catalytic domain-containing endonuclease [Acanthocystis turfacea Chlorella virus NE-JV-2]|nr:GIY-YIG catalytic domain-containing endonuclease [Acanthocystis turfacea Chlorella virus NE-JV-2]